MKTVQVVIEIPENDYNHIREYYEKNEIVETTYSYIYHGTVLPDRHGRLIDVDALNEQIIPAIKKDGVIYVKLLALQDLIDDAPTMLEGTVNK